ncbi:MAG TPA: hypothetical protein VHC95_03915 [Opitutales bacterium]|nr:hypothetical protein [Opitutales bacterium]
MRERPAMLVIVHDLDRLRFGKRTCQRHVISDQPTEKSFGLAEIEIVRLWLQIGASPPVIVALELYVSQMFPSARFEQFRQHHAVFAQSGLGTSTRRQIAEIFI